MARKRNTPTLAPAEVTDLEPIVPKTFVSYHYVMEDGTSGFDFVFIEDLGDITTEQQVRNLRAHLQTNLEGGVKQVAILNWKALDG
jgi:hypothetical protein